MKKTDHKPLYLSVVAGLVALWFVAGFYLHWQPAPSLERDVLGSTVRVEVRSDRGVGIGSGSGTFIDDRHVLTNHHVVNKEKGVVQVRGWISADGVTYPVIYDAEVVASSEDVDLAILRITDVWVGPVAELSDRDPPMATTVCKSGAALGKRPRVTCGLWGGVDERMSGKIRHVSHDAATAPGDSGGGVWAVVDGQYQVVAVTRAIPNLGEGGLVTTMGLAIPLDVVREFVREHLGKSAADK